MGVYTQSIYEYLNSLKLDPFKDTDLVRGAESLGMYYYVGIPRPVMQNLFVKFMRRYMMNEINSLSVDEFRLHLIGYMKERENWYTTMFETYKDLLPYDMLETVTETTSTQETDNETLTDRISNQKSTSDTRSNDTTNITSISTTTSTTENTDEDKITSTQSDESKVNSTDESDATTTTTDSSTIIETFDESNNRTGENRTTKSQTENISEDNAEGVGAVNSVSPDGAMINKTIFKKGNSSTSGEDKLVIDETTTNDGERNTTNTTNREDTNISASTHESTTTNNSSKQEDIRRSSTTTTNTGTSNESEQSHIGQSTITGENDTTENTVNKAKGILESTQTTKTKGINVWKPELARKFYDQYVSIDSEWIDGARDLFYYIY